jgi:O-acetyl-ADP-ribose deacetylase (regulator of RNase III)
MRVLNGDLLVLAREGAFDLIVHGCNCFCMMGAGIAAAIRCEFPAAYEADLATARGDRAKLGTCSFATVEQGGKSLTIVNAYTQYHASGSGVLVDYDAVRNCLRWIKERFPGKRIGLPKIGAGLAGGDWQQIASIIEEELAGQDVTVVEYRP